MQIATVHLVKRLFPGIVAVSFLPGCSGQRPSPSGPRPRIVTFSPALSEIVFAMGLGANVVGVSRFSILPPGQQRPVLGDANDVNAEAILAHHPDVLLVQTSELRRFEALRQIDPNLKIEQFAIETIADIHSAMQRIGRIAGRQDLAEQALERFDAELQAVVRRVAALPRPRVIFVLGTSLPAVAGPDTFVHDLIELAGGNDVGSEIPGRTRWRRAGIEAILAARPDVLICQVFPPEDPVSAKRYWMGWKDLPAAHEGRVFVVTDRRWSIPSPALAELAPELAEMIHPALAGGGQHR